MVARPEDWFRQAERDLAHAQRSLQLGDFEWSCFASQQAAEKAVNAVYQRHGAEARGPSVAGLLAALGNVLPEAEQRLITESLLDWARELDRHYIPARYPDAHPQGAPYESYTRAEAERATGCAEVLLRFCRDLLAR
jgi:HEPN domain-containing protein